MQSRMVQEEHGGQQLAEWLSPSRRPHAMCLAALQARVEPKTTTGEKSVLLE